MTAESLPRARFRTESRVCRICGHKVRAMTACRIKGCDGERPRPWLPIKQDMHMHCAEKCLCTTGGCYPEAEDDR